MDIEYIKKRLTEINKKNDKTKEYSLGDACLLDVYEKKLENAGYSRQEIEKLSPSYYISVCECVYEYNDDHHGLLVYQCPKCQKQENDN